MAETESLNVMIQKLNPLTGEYGWQVQDELYDFHQEIARSAFADMLHDSERNEKYYEGIRAAIEQTHRQGKMAHVLDIGTGTGLLAMMAARCGADTIHACEAFSPISACAEKVIEENGLADRITVIHKRSTAMTVGDSESPGDLPRRCNILVTEVFDTELIGEGAIATFNHAHKHLLERDCLVVPSRGTVYAQVVESDWMQRWNRLSAWGEVVPSRAIQSCPGAAAVHDLQLSQLRPEDFHAITEPLPVFRFDWTCRSPIPEDDSTEVLTKALTTGTAQMVFMWWSLDMDPQGEIELSCAPWWAHPWRPPGPDAIPWRDHWMQAVYYLPTQAYFTQGQTLRLVSSHDEFSMWFNLGTSENPDIKQSKRPVCDCMLHVSCSRTRIGMLNDAERREKYLKVLQRLVTPESVVLSYGDTSLLGLLAATLGAKKVYHVEKNNQSYEVMDELIKDNNLESKVILLPRDPCPVYEHFKSSVNLVVGEPYFTTAHYPWNIVRWWMLRRQWPNAAAMPLSATLYAMPMQFDHLHKIRAPLGTISGFKMTAFDELVQGSSSVSDSDVEVHALWEYPGVCLGQPREIKSFDRMERFVSMGNMPFNVSGTWHGMALWVDIHLDADTTVTTGPVEPPTPGRPVRWDPYTRQAVYFMLPEVVVTERDFLQYKATFDTSQADDIQFKFNLQSDLIILPKKKTEESGQSVSSMLKKKGGESGQSVISMPKKNGGESGQSVSSIPKKNGGESGQSVSSMPKNNRGESGQSVSSMPENNGGDSEQSVSSKPKKKWPKKKGGESGQNVSSMPKNNGGESGQSVSSMPENNGGDSEQSVSSKPKKKWPKKKGGESGQNVSSMPKNNGGESGQSVSSMPENNGGDSEQSVSSKPKKKWPKKKGGESGQNVSSMPKNNGGESGQSVSSMPENNGGDSEQSVSSKPKKKWPKKKGGESGQNVSSMPKNNRGESGQSVSSMPENNGGDSEQSVSSKPKKKWPKKKGGESGQNVSSMPKNNGGESGQSVSSMPENNGVNSL